MNTFTYERFDYTLTELENTINSGKYALLNYLYNEKKIDRETYNFCIKNIAMVIKKPSFFNSIWKKLLYKDKKEELQIIIVEQKSMFEPEKEEKNESTGKTEDRTEGSDKDEQSGVEINNSIDNGRTVKEE